MANVDIPGVTGVACATFGGSETISSTGLTIRTIGTCRVCGFAAAVTTGAAGALATLGPNGDQSPSSRDGVCGSAEATAVEFDSMFFRYAMLFFA